MPAAFDAPTLPAPLASQALPAAPEPGLPTWRRLALRFGWRGSAAPLADLNVARRACLDCLHDVPPIETRWLRQLLTASASFAELWHLRPELYRVLALQHSQAEAERRLAAIQAALDAPWLQRTPR
jgi:hypothetical protein